YDGIFRSLARNTHRAGAAVVDLKVVRYKGRVRDALAGDTEGIRARGRKIQHHHPGGTYGHRSRASPNGKAVDVVNAWSQSERAICRNVAVCPGHSTY